MPISEPDELLDTRTPRFSVQSTHGFPFDVSIDPFGYLLVDLIRTPRNRAQRDNNELKHLVHIKIGSF